LNTRIRYYIIVSTINATPNVKCGSYLFIRYSIFCHHFIHPSNHFRFCNVHTLIYSAFNHPTSRAMSYSGSFYTSAKHIFHLHWNSLNKLNTLGVQSHRKVLIPLIKGYYKYLKTSTSITTLPFTAIAFLVISFSELILCMLCFTSTKSESQLQFQLSKPFLALYHTPILKFLNTKHWFVNFLKCIYQFTRIQ